MGSMQQPSLHICITQGDTIAFLILFYCMCHAELWYAAYCGVGPTNQAVIHSVKENRNVAEALAADIRFLDTYRPCDEACDGIEVGQKRRANSQARSTAKSQVRGPIPGTSTITSKVRRHGRYWRHTIVLQAGKGCVCPNKLSLSYELWCRCRRFPL